MKLYHPYFTAFADENEAIAFSRKHPLDFYSLNHARKLLAPNQLPQTPAGWICADDSVLKNRLTPVCDSKKGWTHFALTSSLKEGEFELTDSLPEKELVSVFMNTSMLNESWIRPWMKKLLSKTDRVCIPALSYFNDTKNEHDWNLQYSPVNGQFYKCYQDVLYGYGISPEQIEWINPFQDSPAQMQSKILNCNVLFLPGGAPELFMKRLKQNKLTPLLKNWSGLMIGVSAGAMIQLGKYHITPDSDYPEFGWYQGLGLHPDFDIECHYSNSRVQQAGIQRALRENPLPIYALYENGALMVDTKGKKTLYGKADLFEALPAKS